MMEFIVNTDEYMHVKVIETTREIISFQNVLATAVYDIYHGGDLVNPKVSNQPVNTLTENTFKCRIAPDSTWVSGIYALYLKITDIPGFAEKPRLGPFRFHVIA